MNENTFEEVDLNPDIEKFLTSEEAELRIRLNSPVEIENALVGLLAVERRIEWLKELKRHRIEQIDNNIHGYEVKIDGLRQFIQISMEQFGEKNLDFPGVARVTVKNTPARWEVIDQEKLFNLLKTKHKFGDVVKMEPKIIAKELNVFLDDTSSKDNKELTEVAKKNEGVKSLSITKHKSKADVPAADITGNGTMGF